MVGVQGYFPSSSWATTNKANNHLALSETLDKRSDVTTLLSSLRQSLTEPSQSAAEENPKRSSCT